MTEVSAQALGASDVLIVGGGLQGLSSALQLARRGYRVRVLEADYCGRHASGVNAGGVRTLGRHAEEIPLALAARDRFWHHLPEFIGAECGFVASGQIKIAENEAESSAALARIARLNALGFTHERWVGREEARELVPRLAPHVAGGIWSAGDGYAVPYKVVTAFRRAAQAAGAHIHEATLATRIERMGGVWRIYTRGGYYQAPSLVNAAGGWADEIARQTGDPVSLSAEGLMLMVTQRVPPFIRPVLGAMGRPLSFKQFDNGTVVIGGGLRGRADTVARRATVETSAMKRSARTVLELFPFLRDAAIVRCWAGVEAVTPDQLPVIGTGGEGAGIVHAFGFSGHGFELSPIVGCIVADLIEHGRTPWPIAPFAIDRFAAG
ncbi:NAD(P)/FAD-dependent oxidoreductase [Brenneria corticis]|uniref:FAD-dependent oxidoreductase n=1 Tax=Brenneria corticis TaxID=2173106 RepID=A0A2U1U489_9GAMM|nr:FAD-binding oxidoreductase [Brenneria sp. CFCC 11842]PWC16442.1 FAD-dependent oxidoreductase [Brenneria sp. CFCC 11842]